MIKQHVTFHLSTFIREASIGSRWRSAQRPATGWGTENTWWLTVFSTKQDIYVTPLLPRWKKHYKSQRQWGTVLNTTGQLCIDITEVVTVCTRPVPAQASQNPSMGRGGLYKVQPLTEELLAISSFWERKSQLCLKRVTSSWPKALL